MERVLLQLLKPWKIYKRGDIVKVPQGIMPERMIRNKTAKRYVAKKKINVISEFKNKLRQR